MSRRGGYPWTMSPIARAGMAGLGNIPSGDPGLGNAGGLGWSEDDPSMQGAQDSVQTDWPTYSATYNPGVPLTSGSSLDFNELIKMGKELGISYLAYDQQKMMQQINLERVRRGMSPLSMSSLAPQMNFGLAPDTLNYLLIGGAVLAVLMLMGRRH